ncbi:MAG: hypothetical protein E7270_11955 [Lachnospiraceae bacterium]|nr:hypothetical protein [Lachnospiraceae bacterium]
MTFKKKGLLCLIISLAIFFSGIYMQNAEADSLFSGHLNVINTKTVNFLSKETTTNTACTVEEINGRNTTSAIVLLKRNSYERNLRNFRFVLQSEILDKIFSYSDIVVERRVLLPEYHNLSILMYIHNKDGKK